MQTPAVRLKLFGLPMVEWQGGASALPFERRTQLLVLLALRRQWVPRAEVAAMLWPEQPQKLAYANLRKTLFRLDALPWAAGLPPQLQVQAQVLRFDAAIDVQDFEAALAQGREADALALYQGELLQAFDDGQGEAWTRWLTLERERLHAAWRRAASRQLADPALPAAQALALSARLLEHDPLDEPALQLHVQLLQRQGQHGAARQAVRRHAERLQQELGVAPGAALRALLDRVDESPAAALPPAPVADAGFVGRSAELQRIEALLSQPDCRLLCLVGPGGVGKTRLARRAAQRMAPRHADGARLVALEDVETEAAFGMRLAQEAGVAGERSGGHAPGDALGRALAAWAGHALLLVLDNFDPLAGHAPLLDRMLQQCPRLHLVVTSRTRLALASAWTLAVDGLPCPDPEDDDRAEAFDAVRLFDQAARRVHPAFDLQAERAHVVEVCRRVGGMPLALELAAAWVRVLPCRAIADELARGLDLLQSPDARHPPRHASLETVFDQSWRRLGAAEREALARLAVLQGGFSAETARAVAQAPLPLLGALADKSLLARAGDDGRLHLHPLVQQLAGRRLDEAGGRPAAEEAHACWFAGWLQRHAAGASVAAREVLQAIDQDFENCRRAWAHAARQGRAAWLRAMLPALHHYLEQRARFDEGLALMQAALQAPSLADAALHACLQGEAATMAMRLARYSEAEALARAALAGARPAREREARYRAYAVLGACALATGRFAAARSAYRRALALARARGQPIDLAATLDNLSLCAKRVGDYELALHLAREALAQHRRHGDAARLGVCLNNLGSMLSFMDDDAQARLHLQEARALSERHGLRSTQAFVQANLTELALKSGELAAAHGHATQALAVAGAGGMRSLAAWLHVQLARVASRRGDLAEARAQLATGAAMASSLELQSVKPAVLMALAELFEAQGHAGAARRVLAFGAGEPALSAPDRDELRAAWARRTSADRPQLPWPGLTLPGLLARVAGEAEAGYASLLALLA